MGNGGSRRKGEKMTILMKFFNENLKLTMSKGITQYSCYQAGVLLCWYHFFVDVWKIKGNMIKSSAIHTCISVRGNIIPSKKDNLFSQWPFNVFDWQ